MPAVGGSLESISLRGRTLPVASDADATRNLGGFMNEVQSNGDGSARIIKTRMPWSLGGVVVEIDDARGDQEFLQELSNAQDYFDVALRHASGVVYQARGMLTEAVEVSTQATTATLSLAGPGEMSQQ